MCVCVYTYMSVCVHNRHICIYATWRTRIQVYMHNDVYLPMKIHLPLITCI